MATRMGVFILSYAPVDTTGSNFPLRPFGCNEPDQTEERMMNCASRTDSSAGNASETPPTICSRHLGHIEQEQRNRDYKNIPHVLSISVYQFQFSIRWYLGWDQNVQSTECSLLARRLSPQR